MEKTLTLLSAGYGIIDYDTVIFRLHVRQGILAGARYLGRGQRKNINAALSGYGIIDYDTVIFRLHVRRGILAGVSCLEEGVSAKSIVIAFGAGFFCRFFEWEIAFLGLLSYNNFIG